MRFTLTFVIGLAISACLTDPIPDSIRNPRGDNDNSDNRNPAEQTPSEELPSPQGRTYYVCGVQSSPKDGNHLVLFKGTERQFSLLCDDSHYISADPDTHFLFDGFLYTAWHGKGKTVICKNGEKLYSWNQEEYIKDMIMSGDELWTISIPLGAGGFRLRKDAVIKYSNASGSPGDLYIDNGSVCFRYSERATGRKRLHLVKDASDVLTEELDGAQHDLRIVNGQIWSLTHEEGEVLLKCGKHENWYKPHAGFTTIGGTICVSPDGEAFASIRMQSNYSPMQAEQIHLPDTTVLCGTGSGSFLISGQYPMRLLTLDKDMKNLHIGSLSKGDENYTLPEVMFAGKRCAAQESGRLYLALTPKDTGKDGFIWSEGQTYAIDLKGTVSGICFSQSK